MSAYLEKLRDPRWQKKRLEVLTRDDWCCQMCFDSKSTLHVHHMYYEAGHEPWDYPLTTFRTLCETCHTEEGESKRETEAILIKSLRRSGALNAELYELQNVFEPFYLDDRDWSVLSCFLKYLLFDRDAGGSEWNRVHDLARAQWKMFAVEMDKK